MRSTLVSLATVVSCALLCGAALPAAANDFAVAPTGVFPNYAWNVGVDGGAKSHNPTLQLLRGRTYTFTLSGITAAGGIHSFYLNTINTTASTSQYTDGVSSFSHTSDGTVTFVVPQTAPDTLFYNCGTHSSMAGQIQIDGVFADGFEGT